MSTPGPFEQSFNWFSDRHFTLWPLSLLRPAQDQCLGPRRVLLLGTFTAAAVVVLVTLLRWTTGRPVDAFATAGISVIALLLSWLWFALAARAWNRRARRLGGGIAARR